MLEPQCIAFHSLTLPHGILVQSRLYGEAISIFSHGASLNSFQLMWRLHMLDEIMLPYGEYARKHKVPR